MKTLCVLLKGAPGGAFPEFARTVADNEALRDRLSAISGAYLASLNVVLWQELARENDAGNTASRPMDDDWQAMLHVRVADPPSYQFDGHLASVLPVGTISETHLFETRVVEGEPIEASDGGVKLVLLWNRPRGITRQEAVARHRGRHVDLVNELESPQSRYAVSGSLAPDDAGWDGLVEQWYPTLADLTSVVRGHVDMPEMKKNVAGFVGYMQVYVASEFTLWSTNGWSR